VAASHAAQTPRNMRSNSEVVGTPPSLPQSLESIKNQASALDHMSGRAEHATWPAWLVDDQGLQRLQGCRRTRPPGVMTTKRRHLTRKVTGVCAGGVAEDAGFEPARAITPNTISNSAPYRTGRSRCGVLAGHARYLNRVVLPELNGTETPTETLCPNSSNG
jgi:hypothetical protein